MPDLRQCESCWLNYTPTSNRQKNCEVCRPFVQRRRINRKTIRKGTRDSIAYVINWLDGNESGLVANHNVLMTCIRKFLIALRGPQCELCGWAQKNPQTNKVPIQVDHIDGDWSNCRPENLRILCPNCHSLTTTYGNLNYGKGRKSGKTTSSFSSL